eukprot:TRINITY_DN2308_c5_g1_i1.p2 TRINITY_DN2308_c5_g1~~TRINITY_DN2308_c5_g1_i1.p2  ORF type:complete len:251 (+),score=62.23 TRINITY_DN2308_c5_g1_i1:80-754(+)
MAPAQSTQLASGIIVTAPADCSGPVAAAATHAAVLGAAAAPGIAGTVVGFVSALGSFARQPGVVVGVGVLTAIGCAVWVLKRGGGEAGRDVPVGPGCYRVVRPEGVVVWQGAAGDSAVLRTLAEGTVVTVASPESPGGSVWLREPVRGVVVCRAGGKRSLEPVPGRGPAVCGSQDSFDEGVDVGAELMGLVLSTPTSHGGSPITPAQGEAGCARSFPAAKKAQQ